MSEQAEEGTIEARQIILRDKSGKIRGRWSAGFGMSALELLGADEKPRIEISVEESEYSSFKETFVGQVVFYGKDAKPMMRLQGFNDSGFVTLLDVNGRTRATLGLQHFEDQQWPQLILSGENGWKMMLMVHDDLPHFVMYDHENVPRVHLAVDHFNRPHVRRYWWKRLIQRWKWIGYYPRRGGWGTAPPKPPTIDQTTCQHQYVVQPFNRKDPDTAAVVDAMSQAIGMQLSGVRHCKICGHVDDMMINTQPRA